LIILIIVDHDLKPSLDLIAIPVENVLIKIDHFAGKPRLLINFNQNIFHWDSNKIK
jgi:hypothetical protein